MLSAYNHILILKQLHGSADTLISFFFHQKAATLESTPPLIAIIAFLFKGYVSFYHTI